MLQRALHDKETKNVRKQQNQQETVNQANKNS